MPSLFLVMLGGAAGSGARYLVGRWALAGIGGGWPWGTLIVNLVGGFLMGMLVARGGGEQTRLLLGVGVLGGFTTFSAFSLEVMLMIERGQWAAALLYILVSVVGAVGGVALGMSAMRVAA